MFVNRYQLNINNISSGETGNYFNIPFSMDFQIVDQTEIVDRVFVDVETEKAINPIVDYEKVRFSPIDVNDDKLNKITYNVILNEGSTYYAAGFSYDDIRFQRETLKQTFLNLNFYDSDNPLSQNLVTNITLYPQFNSSDLQQFSSPATSVGQVLQPSQIPLSFVLDVSPNGFNTFVEGYFIYDYKDEIPLNGYKYLYARGFFNNAKTGKSTNLMVKSTPQPIDELVHELYTRYKLIRNENGFYYQIDDTYQGNSGNTGTNNVIYSNDTATINLYQILAL
jgi:hypothetical protein